MNILTETQKKVIAFLAKEKVMQRFYLAGGTALSAYYFFHRLSDDLDFFTKEPFSHRDEIIPLVQKLKENIGAEEVKYEKVYDRYLYFFSFSNGEILKMEFSAYPFPSLSEKKECDDIFIDSIEDIAAGKLMAMLDRFDPKDFVDLYFLLQNFSLDTIRNLAEKKFGTKIDNIFLGAELIKVKNITALPIMKKNISVLDIQNFFFDITKKLKEEVLS